MENKNTDITGGATGKTFDFHFIGGYMVSMFIALFIGYAILFVVGRHYVNLMDFSLLNHFAAFFFGYALVSIFVYDGLQRRVSGRGWVTLYLGYKIVRIIAFLAFLYGYVFLINPHNPAQYPVVFIVIAFLVDFFAYLLGDTLYFVRWKSKSKK